MDISTTPWKKIRLELAGTPEFPAGSASRAYFVQLPLNEQGEFDRDTFQLRPNKAIFRRHWASEPDELGQIVQAGGKLAMRSKCAGDRILDLGRETLRLGQLVYLVDSDGDTLPLRIVSVR